MNAELWGATRRALAVGLLLACRVLPAAAVDWSDPLRSMPDAGAGVAPVVAARACEQVAGPLAGLSLAQALTVALCRHPQLAAARAEIDINAAALGQARAAYLPTASATVSRLRQRTGYPDSDLDAALVRSRTAYATLSWRLFDFGVRAANQEAARSMLDAAQAGHAAAVQQVLGALVRAYFDAQTADETLDARTAELRAADALLASARRREARGGGARGDTLQAGSAQARARLERGRAEGARLKALAQLVLAMGVPADSAVALAPADAEDAGDGAFEMSDASLRDWLAQARTAHPAIVAARAQLEAARSKARASKGEGLPSVDFQLNYYQNGRPGQSVEGMASRELSGGLVLNVPLFDGFNRHYQTRGAQAQVEQKQASLRETEDQVLSELSKSHAELAAAQRNLPVGAELLALARQAVAVAQRRYDNGAGDINELMGAQSALAGARLESIRCRVEWRSARLNLLASAGQLRALALP